MTVTIFGGKFIFGKIRIFVDHLKTNFNIGEQLVQSLELVQLFIRRHHRQDFKLTKLCLCPIQTCLEAFLGFLWAKLK